MGTADFYRDKRILIFGASGGLGQELARQLALRGAARLYLSGRKASALRTLAEELRAKGTKAEILPCDVTHPEALAACIERPRQRTGRRVHRLRRRARKKRRRTGGAGGYRPVSGGEYGGAGGGHGPALPVLGTDGRRPFSLRGDLAGRAPAAPVCAGVRGVEGGAECLRRGLRDRLRASDTALTLVMPGFFDSPMGRRFRGRKWFVLSAAEAAEKTLDGTARGRERCIFPRALHGAIVLAQVLPRWLVRPVMGLFAFETLPEEHTET